MKSSLAQVVARVFGAVFLLVGVAGFIPGLTTGHVGLAHNSSALLLGLFAVSVLHNVVHAIYGLVGLGASTTHARSVQYLIYGGVIYLVLFLYGLSFLHSATLNFIPINGADNVLHLVLGLTMVGAGVALRQRRDSVTV